MRLKQIFTTLLLAGVLVVSTTACGNNNAQPNASVSSSSVSTQSELTEIKEVDNNFDFEEVRKNVVINGKTYTFPFSVDDLGEGFSLKEDEIMYSKSSEDTPYYFVTTDLYYNDIDIATVTYCGITEEEMNNESIDFNSREIEYIFQSTHFHNINGMYIEMDGFKIGDDSEKILQKYGTPNNEKSSGDANSYIYYGIYNENKKEIVTFMNDGNDMIYCVEIATLKYGSI